MLKELAKIELKSKIIDFKLEDAGVVIKTEDGKEITISDEHDQECCENVYADFSVLELYAKDIIGKTVEHLIVKGVEDVGFLLCFYDDSDSLAKALICCYNSQNGYYSSALTLVLEKEGVKTLVDISEFVEDKEG
jgi:hypothetical protein